MTKRKPRATGQDIGYVRVSSVGQNTARQLEGVELDRVFEEKASAKDAKRPKLQEALKYLREGDTLHVHSLDRLARNLLDLQNIVGDLTGRGVTLHSHKEGLKFTAEADPMAKLLLQVMGAVAEFERSLIKERQREGIAAAKKAGKQIGAKPKLTPDQQAALLKELETTRKPKAQLAREYGISRETLYKVIRDNA